MRLPEARERRSPGAGQQTGSASGHGPLKVGLILALIVFAGVTGYFGYGYYQSTLRPSWLFKGAYALYAGNATLPLPISEITIGLRVMDFNSSKVEMSYSFYRAYTCVPPGRCGSPESRNITEWVNIQAAPTLMLFSFVGATPVNPSATTFSLRNQTYGVTAYKYEMEGTLFTVYIYPKVGFPLGYRESDEYNPSFGLDAGITHTNIAGLSSIASSASRI